MASKNVIHHRSSRNIERMVLRLLRIVVSETRLKPLVAKLLNILRKELGVKKVALLIIDAHEVLVVAQYGFRDAFSVIPNFHQLLHGMKHSGAVMLFPKHLSDEALKDFFAEHELALAVPIQLKKDEVAVLLLGKKDGVRRRGRNAALRHGTYIPRELYVLRVFAESAGVALHDAILFQKLRALNKRLEERVKERTKQLGEACQKELDQARSATKLKDEFVFLAAHELRSPVAAIRGFLEMASEESNLPPDVQKNLISASIAVARLGQLVGDLLEVGRSESGLMRLNLSSHNLLTIVEFSVNQSIQAVQEKKIRVSISVPGECPMVICDPSKTTEVIQNLLNNAIKYNRQNGHVEVMLYPEGGSLVTEVHDTGYGIPKDQQEKIFQKFFRATMKETREVGGTGLGLFIVRMLIEKMGGKVWFRSVEGEGSTFAFSLPLAPTESKGDRI